MLLAAFLLLFSIAYAHLEEEVPEAIGEEKIGIEDYIKTTSLNYLFVASIMILVLVLFSLFYKEKEKIKLFLFLFTSQRIMPQAAWELSNLTLKQQKLISRQTACELLSMSRKNTISREPLQL